MVLWECLAVIPLVIIIELTALVIFGGTIILTVGMPIIIARVICKYWRGEKINFWKIAKETIF